MSEQNLALILFALKCAPMIGTDLLTKMLIMPVAITYLKLIHHSAAEWMHQPFQFDKIPQKRQKQKMWKTSFLSLSKSYFIKKWLIDHTQRYFGEVTIPQM